MKLHVIRQRSLWWTISLTIIISGLIAMIISWTQLHSPLRPGLDFVGGTRLQLELDCNQAGNCEQPIDPAAVRETLSEQGLGNSSIQLVGQHGLSIRTSTLSLDQRTKLQTVLTEKIGTFDPKTIQSDTVGPVVGRQLFTSGILSLVVSFVGIAVYLSLRFQFDYAVFAIVALLHDVLITVGIFSILGLIPGLEVEVDSLFIVALLTIVGFSVNDTVVIYDRIRETIQLNPHRHINDVVDDAVNQTLTRSINTTLTVLLTLVAIFLFGGETLKYFALALIIGFTMGAYSSIFIASTLLALWREKTGQAIAVPEKISLKPADAVSIDDA